MPVNSGQKRLLKQDVLDFSINWDRFNIPHIIRSYKKTTINSLYLSWYVGVLRPAPIIGRGMLRCCRLRGSGSQEVPSTSPILWLLICMVIGHWEAARICRASRWLKFARLRPFLWDEQTEMSVTMLASNIQNKHVVKMIIYTLLFICKRHFTIVHCNV